MLQVKGLSESVSEGSRVSPCENPSRAILSRLDDVSTIVVESISRSRGPTVRSRVANFAISLEKLRVPALLCNCSPRPVSQHRAASIAEINFDRGWFAQETNGKRLNNDHVAPTRRGRKGGGLGFQLDEKLLVRFGEMARWKRETKTRASEKTSEEQRLVAKLTKQIVDRSISTTRLIIEIEREREKSRVELCVS